jgi:hypothetical protein
MPVTTTWADETQTLLFLRYAGVWTWQDYFESKRALVQMADQVNHPIDIISYAEANSRHPSTGMISNISQGLAMLPENIRLMVVVTDNLFMSTAASLLPRVRTIDSRIRAVDNLEQAYRLIGRSAGV